MKTILSSASFILVMLAQVAVAQVEETQKYTAHNKGKFTVSWGGNRDNYSKSDITFKGDTYNFTVQNAVAHDSPKGWHVDYINPGRMTIPQTNFKMGYFFTDKYSISLGVDHMKYVMTQNQMATINGVINRYPPFDGTFSNTAKALTEDFLTFEHTDGLNYVYTEIARQDDISKWFGIKNTDKFQVNINEGFGLGVLLPKTNAKLLSQARHDAFHLSGFGTSVKAGINFVFFKHFTIEGDLKGGYINMPDIRTTNNKSDTAKQHFFFLEKIIAFGAIFKI